MVPGDKKKIATQITVIWIFPSITFHVSLQMVPGDECVATQSTVKWILPSMTLHVFMFMWLEPWLD